MEPQNVRQTLRCHSPRKRGTQLPGVRGYWAVTGSPAFAGDDTAVILLDRLESALVLLRHKNRVIAGLDPAIQLLAKKMGPRVTQKGASLLGF
jgi:hypothetical protein